MRIIVDLEFYQRENGSVPKQEIAKAMAYMEDYKRRVHRE